MQCTDENYVDSYAAKTLQAETRLSCIEHLRDIAMAMILGMFSGALS